MNAEEVFKVVKNEELIYNGINYIPKISKSVYDPIYGQIGFEQKIWSVLETFHFQRLRNLKQLGSVYFVYPGATHSRFEHSLGVGHLSSVLLNQLLCSGTLDKAEFRTYQFPIILGGVCHDLGHGPFSHLFDNMVIKKLIPNTDWKHENASVMILNDLIDKYSLDISKEEIKLACNIILGNDTNNNWNTWKYEIVANYNNSLDFDKIDYICRDVYHLGISSSTINYSSIINGIRIIDNSMCYNVENTFEINSIFSSRYYLFKKVYQHKVCQGIDLMIRDCLILADPVYKFEDKINNVEEYLKLSDNILLQIENSKAKSLAESRALIERIRKRNLYKCVKEILIKDDREKEIFLKLTAEDLCNYQTVNGYGDLTENDVEIIFFKINCGLGQRNPFEHIKFYQNDGEKSVITSGNKTSFAKSDKFEETYIRLFVKDRNKSDLAKGAFDNFIQKMIKN